MTLQRTGSIDRPGSVDIYELQGNAGDGVEIQAADDCEPDRLLWDIRRPDNSLIGGIRDMCMDIGRVTFDQDGTYTIHAYGAQDSTGDYTFTVEPT